MLPLLPDSSEPAKVQAQEPPASPGCRVLVIDDDHDCADTLREVLELGGHEVEVAYDGQEGVARFEALHPDVVFCDIGLPGLDGYEVARQIRRLDDDAPPTLIALSGYALPEDRRKALEAGFDYHLGKPLALDELEALLVRITRRA
jgi:CheY-like chemotaxis protein